jgi:hypothetical protein
LVFSNNARIYIFGAPKSIKINDSEYYSHKDPIQLLLCGMNWKEITGDIIKIVDEKYKDYISIIKNWNFQFEKNYSTLDDYELKKISNEIGFKIDEIQLQMNPIALNNYGRPIAAEFKIFAIQNRDQKKKESVSIVWFPVEENHNSYIEYFINSFFNIEIQVDMLEWVKKYKLDSMFAIENKIRLINEEIKDKANIVNNKKLELENREKLLILLYGQGKMLEESVVIALKELGCRIIETSSTRKEDVRFMDPDNNYWICEIKGRKGNLKRDDIRQLDDWIKQAMLNEDWHGYAGIIGNFQIELNIDKRKDYISENEEKALNRFGFSIIETMEIYEQLNLKEKNKYDPKIFWKSKIKKAI